MNVSMTHQWFMLPALVHPNRDTSTSKIYCWEKNLTAQIIFPSKVQWKNKSMYKHGAVSFPVAFWLLALQTQKSWLPCQLVNYTLLTCRHTPSAQAGGPYGPQ